MKTLLLTLLTASLTLTTFGQSDYQKVRKMNVLADKKRFVLAMDRQEQARAIWRPHFAYVLITERLNLEQKEFLPRAIDALEYGELTEKLDQEAGELFDKDLGKIVFNPGPYTKTGTLCEEPKLKFEVRGPVLFNVSLDCNCRQTGTNWSCDGSCDASSCKPTDSGCSIFWAYPCDGKCQ